MNELDQLDEIEVESLINEYTELQTQIKELKSQAEKARKKFTYWLDNQGATRCATRTFVATKQTRKGVVDIKQIQTKYGILDSELENYRKQPTQYWSVKKKGKNK